MERIDRVGFGDYRLAQDPTQFCYGIDAVILADFAQAKSSDIIADLGTGNGVIPLILYHKSHASRIVGVEKQNEAYELAVRNGRMNGLTDCLEWVCCDVTDLQDHFPPGGFSLVVSNPPYVEKDGGPTNRSKHLETARHETTGTLEDFVKAAAYLLLPLGSFCLVHRPSRLVDILWCCRKHRLEPKRLRFVAPRTGEAPNIVLVQCVKNGGKELNMEPTLVVRDEQGRYSAEIDRIYERDSNQKRR
ncbi:MAG: tRNA1(Val) (adenine(37)-N6)-methyltransferase [Anaerovoracaceae bacterium]